LKIVNQTLLENFQSKSAEKISIKVCLQKVKLILSSNNPGFMTEQSIRQPVFNQRSLEFFQARSAENFSIRVCLKNENRSLIDPDQNFNRDRDRDCIFPSRVRFYPAFSDPWLDPCLPVPEMSRFCKIVRDQFSRYSGRICCNRAPFGLKKIYSAKDVNKPVPW
jgi:hypothetical protein